MLIEEEYENIIKLLVIGSPNVGKSNFIFRFTENKFSDNHQATIGMELKTKNLLINNKTYKIQIWDTSGEEKFKNISRNYFLRVQGILLMFDLTNNKSFEDLDKLIKNIINIRDKIPLIIIGNKCDLENEIVIKDEEVKKFANENDAMYIKTSAKLNKNIEYSIITFVKHIIDLNVTDNNKTYVLDGSSFTNEKEGCCSKKK